MILRYILTSAIIAACHLGMLAAHSAAPSVTADNIVDGVTVDHFFTERDGSYLSIDFTFGLDRLHVSSGQCVLLSPAVVNGIDSIALPPVAVYGRNRYYYYQRQRGGDKMLTPDALTYMAKDKPDSIDYHRLIHFADWMDGAKVTLRRIDRGCCGDEILREYGEIGIHHEKFFPELIFIKPKGEIEKRRSLEGTAFVDFPVDQTIIYPEYRNNTHELDSIRKTIDAVRYDPDARIDSVWLKGYASPESPYSHNTDLAIGRTKALMEYINNLYHFENVVLSTDYEPEDWEGLRKAVVNSNIEHRSEILALIDSDMEPDAKEAKIKRLYPREYKFMLQNFYPPLRHTNYKVSYVIRTFNDPAEIFEKMRTEPQKLSTNEFYVAASVFEPGSEEFSEIFETAVRMFPSNEVVNLNAANAALRRGDMFSAKRYVKNAGNTPEAIYTRAAIAIREKDLDTARPLLQQAAAAGLQLAGETLEELNKRSK